VNGLKRAALLLLVAHACALVDGVAQAQQVTMYQASYTFKHDPLYESVPAAVEGLIKAMEGMNGTDCSSSFPDVPPEQATKRKCTYLDHEADGVHFRMRQVVDSRNGAEVIHSEQILGGTYQTFGPWVVTRQHPPPRSCPAQLTVGKPIHPILGSKSLREELRVGRIGGEPMVAIYDTMAGAPIGRAAEFPPAVAASFGGRRWSSNLHRRLQPQFDGGHVMQAVHVQRADGHWESFVLDKAGTQYQPDPDVTDRLERIAGGWRYTDASTLAQETYADDGRLLSVVYTDGRRLTYSYNGNVLASVQDQSGRRVQFSYDHPEALLPRLTQVSGPAGTTTHSVSRR